MNKMVMGSAEATGVELDDVHVNTFGTHPDRHRTYLGNDRSHVEIEVDGYGYDGGLRSWDQGDDGS